MFVRDEFAPFYKALFTEQVRREEMSSVFLEYAWDMNWCDPCAADPLSREELRKLGVFWLGADDGSGAQNVFLTRLHVRYDRAHFPEDLVFQQTGDKRNFQARYVLHHAWTGSSDCPGARDYQRELRNRREREAINLSHITGWAISDVRKKMKIAAVSPPTEKRWWESLW